jgi:DNA polymerase-3 subunit alpha
MVLRVDARRCRGSLIDELRTILEHFPGNAEVLLEMETSSGARRLRFGSDFRVARSHALQAELDELLGPDALVA